MPVIWLIDAYRAGERGQVRALVDTLEKTLGAQVQTKVLSYRKQVFMPHVLGQASLRGITARSAEKLAGPWPDLVISAGRRNEPVAQWIRQQSGGRTRLVHMGRPWAPLNQWDLLVTTPQYFLPRQDNVLHNSLPLHLPDAEGLAHAASELEARITELPRPRIAVFAGGDSGKFVFTVEKGERLGATANALATAAGGSILFTDSPRTPACAGDAVVGELTVPHMEYRCAEGVANPYRGMLGLADAFIVTGESMSMLGEAAETGRPLFIFDMGDGDTPWWQMPHGWFYKPLSHHLAMRFGPERMRRDIGQIQDTLVSSGKARWLDGVDVEQVAAELNTPRDSGTGIAAEELERSVAAVRQLFESR